MKHLVKLIFILFLTAFTCTESQTNHINGAHVPPFLHVERLKHHAFHQRERYPMPKEIRRSPEGHSGSENSSLSKESRDGPKDTSGTPEKLNGPQVPKSLLVEYIENHRFQHRESYYLPEERSDDPEGTSGTNIYPLPAEKRDYPRVTSGSKEKLIGAQAQPSLVMEHTKTQGLHHSENYSAPKERGDPGGPSGFPDKTPIEKLIGYEFWNFQGGIDRKLEDLLPGPLYYMLNSEWMDKERREDDILQSSERRRGRNVLLDALGKFYLPSTAVANPQCVKDVDIIYNPKITQMLDVTYMVDSWGKLPDGMLVGNTLALGHFDECVNLDIRRELSGTENSQNSFQGKYCLLGHRRSDASKGENQIPKMMPISAMVGSAPPFTYYGTCMPSTCTEEDLRISLNDTLSPYGMEPVPPLCQTRDRPEFEFTAGAIVIIVFLAIEGLFILVGTVADVWIKYSKREQSQKEELRKGSLRYVLVFSIPTNLDKLFHINTSPNPEVISCLHGMRVLSMTWVLWAHQYQINFISAVNKLLIIDLFNGDWMIQVLLNGLPSVDSFFFMGGLLVAYGIFKEQERGRKFNLVMFYVHRILRLAPPILLLCGFMATFPRSLVYGPWASIIDLPGNLQDNCQRYWWADSIFINNFLIESEPSKTCLGVTWYTAVDFQLYFVTPLILLPFIYKELCNSKLFKHVSIGFIWLGIFTAASIAIPAILTGVNELAPTASISEK